MYQNSKLIGIYNDNWLELIKTLKDGRSVTTDKERWNFETPGYNEIYKMWREANFNDKAVKWLNYYSKHHFPESVENLLKQHLGLGGVHRAWISCIEPGFFAPLHWDVDDHEQEYLLRGPIRRFSCFIEEPTHGHIFILGEDYYYNMPLGTLIEWNDYREWHSGINAGMTNKYMFHLLGY